MNFHDQDVNAFAINGNKITPTPQNVSNKQITDVRYFPPVISETEYVIVNKNFCFCYFPRQISTRLIKMFNSVSLQIRIHAYVMYIVIVVKAKTKYSAKCSHGTRIKIDLNLIDLNNNSHL